MTWTKEERQKPWMPREKPKTIVLGKNKTKVTIHPLRKDLKKEAIENVKRIIFETKADKIGQAYSKEDYDRCYSSPRSVLANPDTPSSLADLAYRVIMVSTEDYDENEDNILFEKSNRGTNYRASGASPEEVNMHKQDVAAGQKWVAERPASHHNIVAHYNQATANEKAFGHSWYEDAHHLTKHIANDTKTPMHTMAGLVGNYSPQTDWATNIMTAAKVARTKKGLGGPGSGVFASNAQKRNAENMLSGTHHEDVLKGHKIRAFTHLIEHGGNKDPDKPNVVIDRHAAAVAHGDRITDNAYKHGLGGLKSKKLYGSYEQHYHNAAKEISKQTGTPVHAHQVQAVTWLVRQRLNQGLEQTKHKKGGSGTAARVALSTQRYNDYMKQHHPTLGTDVSKMSGYV